MDESFNSEGDMDIEQLQDTLEALMAENEQVAQENEIFESQLKKQAPDLFQVKWDADSDLQRQGRRGRRLKKTEQAKELTTAQKIDLAGHELEDVRDEIERTKINVERLLDNLRCATENAEIAVAETKKAAYEFKRDVVLGARDDRTNRIMAEKLLRYLDEKLKQREALIEKLRLKNTALAGQISKLQTQLQTKEEMGDVLHQIDFEQLKIENKQFMERIEEKNAELLRLKLTAGKTVQILNMYKKKLATLTEESAHLQREICLRRENLARLGEEGSRVDHEKTKADQTHVKLKTQRDLYRVPQVYEYVTQTCELQDLTKKVLDWQRKVEIAEMGLKRERHRVNATARTQGYVPQPFGSEGLNATQNSFTPTLSTRTVTRS